MRERSQNFLKQETVTVDIKSFPKNARLGNLLTLMSAIY